MTRQTIRHILLLAALPLVLAPVCGKIDGSDTGEDEREDPGDPKETSETSDTSDTDTRLPPVDCVPPSADFSDGTPGQAGIDLDPTDGTCAAVTGLPPSDFLVLDSWGEASFTGSGSRFFVISLSHGSFVNGDGHFALADLPTEVEIKMEVQDQTDASFVTVWFTVDEDGGLYKLAETRVQHVEDL